MKLDYFAPDRRRVAKAAILSLALGSAAGPAGFILYIMTHWLVEWTNNGLEPPHGQRNAERIALWAVILLPGIVATFYGLRICQKNAGNPSETGWPRAFIGTFIGISLAIGWIVFLLLTFRVGV